MLESKNISQNEYQELFNDEAVHQNALTQAQDIRKFEIELYWKRSSYFWTFIGVTLAAYGVVQNIKLPSERMQLSLIVSALGLVFSLSWYFANRGSKQWHENWENHVDLLEDKYTGPLHKTVIRNESPCDFLGKTKGIIVGSGSYSVSKINQIVSCFVTLLWAMLFARSLHIDFCAQVDWFAFFLFLLTLITCVLMGYLGVTNVDDKVVQATKRSLKLKTPKDIDS